MAENKTQATGVDPRAFIESVEHPTRRADALVDVLEQIVSDSVARMRATSETWDN